MKEEILQTRTKVNFYQNNLPDDFPPNVNKFKFLGLMTCRDTDLMNLKGKPISFKTRSRGSIDVVIRNLQEFKNFCEAGTFQRQHLSSLMAHSFDPNFVLNGVYSCLTHLLNGEILSSSEHKISMTTVID